MELTLEYILSQVFIIINYVLLRLTNYTLKLNAKINMKEKRLASAK